MFVIKKDGVNRMIARPHTFGKGFTTSLSRALVFRTEEEATNYGVPKDFSIRAVEYMLYFH